MKSVFAASLCKNGILGGWIFLEGDKLVYRTGKVSVSRELRQIEMPFSEILEIARKRTVWFPSFTVILQGGRSWKFLVFAGRRFTASLSALGLGEKIKSKTN